MKAKLITILNTHVLNNVLSLFYFLCNPYFEPVKVKILVAVEASSKIQYG